MHIFFNWNANSHTLRQSEPGTQEDTSKDWNLKRTRMLNIKMNLHGFHSTVTESCWPMFETAAQGPSIISRWALLALDAFVAGEPLPASSDDVEDQDEDDEQRQGDADSDGHDVVGHVVAVHRSLEENNEA